MCFSDLHVQAGAEGDITWQKDNEDFDDEEKVEKVDESNSKVTIKKASMQDAGKYTCLCEFDGGHRDHIDMQLYIYGMYDFFFFSSYHLMFFFMQNTDL